MEVAESKEELAEMVLRVSPHLINLTDVYTAGHVFSAGYNSKEAAGWGRLRYGAMMTYAAGYVAGIRAERRKKRKNPLGNGNTKRTERNKSVK